MKMSTELKVATAALTEALSAPPTEAGAAALVRALHRYSAASFDDGHQSALLTLISKCHDAEWCTRVGVLPEQATKVAGELLLVAALRPAELALVELRGKAL